MFVFFFFFCVYFYTWKNNLTTTRFKFFSHSFSFSIIFFSVIFAISFSQYLFIFLFRKSFHNCYRPNGLQTKPTNIHKFPSQSLENSKQTDIKCNGPHAMPIKISLKTKQEIMFSRKNENNSQLTFSVVAIACSICE